MVAIIKTAHGFKKAVYLALVIIALTACSNPSSVLILRTHHKPANELADVIPYILGADIQYKVSGNQIVLLGSSEEYRLALETLRQLDAPPVSYTLVLEKIKGKRYSTSNEPVSLSLIEGRVTVTSYQGIQLKLRIRKASDFSSVIEVEAITSQKERHLNQWLITHDTWSHPDNRIFPNGLKLIIDRQ